MKDETPNFDKINIKNLNNWKPGDPLEAAHFDQVVQVLQSLGLLSPSGQVVRDPGKLLQLRMFKVKELAKDSIICFTWNGREKGKDEIKVALPFLLRKTPFDAATRVDPPRAKISYVYSEFNIRIATNEDDDTEDQIIVGSYEEDDIIFAFKGILGNTAVYHDDPTNEKPVLWEDANFDGRFWALDDDPPEAEE